MKYHELKVTKNRSSKRVGRGIAAGQGKTAGRGTKGQNARTGSKRRPGFEGGQNPLMQRLPKLPGFHSHAIKPEVVYTGQLNQFTGSVDSQKLSEAGILSSPFVRVKLIVKGPVTKKLQVKLPNASNSATALIKEAGGSFIATPQLIRPSKQKSQK